MKFKLKDETKMKIFKKALALMSILSVLFSLSGCSLVSKVFHKHSWIDSLIKAPTCTETGIIKKICLGCGETEYSEINTSSHAFENDVCIHCGASKTSLTQITKYPTPSGHIYNDTLSLRRIYEYACEIDCTVSYDEFMRSINGITLYGASIYNEGKVNLSLSSSKSNDPETSVPVTYSYKTIDLTNPGARTEILASASIRNNCLFLTSANGLQITAGSFSSYSEPHIEGFGINYARELIIFYSDNTFGFAGRFVS